MFFSKLRKLVTKDEDVDGQGSLNEHQASRAASLDTVFPSESAVFPGSEGRNANKSKSKPEASRMTNGMRSMDSQLQRKFGKGVHYNMKIIIRGERNVGKTCLWMRLQGNSFKEEYVPTEEIQVCTVTWNYKTTDDVVKVEVWDVVDKSKKKKLIGGPLKLHNSPAAVMGTSGSEPLTEVGLDAETLDVYKGSHGVIMMLDWMKAWTFDYVKLELMRLPPSLPVLILINHRDVDPCQQNTPNAVSLQQVKSYVHHLTRGPDASPVLVAESSMRNGFGLKYLHKFFNLPFLQLQREVVQRQVEQNKNDMELTFQELESLLESEEQNYDRFLRSLVAPTMRKVESEEHPYPKADRSTSFKSESPSEISKSNLDVEKPPSVSASSAPSPSHQTSLNANTKRASKDVSRNIEDFVPEDKFPGEFLDDAKESATRGHSGAAGRKKSTAGQDSSDEDDGGNPMVAGFDEEVDFEDSSAALTAVYSSSSMTTAGPLPLEGRTSPKERDFYHVEQHRDVESPVESASPVEVSPSPQRDAEEGNNPADFMVQLVDSSLVSLSPSEMDTQSIAEAEPEVRTIVAFSPDELSSWLEAVERKPSLSLPTPVETAKESQTISEVKPPKKSKKKTAKSKTIKSTSDELPAESPSGKSVQEQKAKKSVVERKSSRDYEASMVKELEEFLASDDD